MGSDTDGIASNAGNRAADPQSLAVRGTLPDRPPAKTPGRSRRSAPRPPPARTICAGRRSATLARLEIEHTPCFCALCVFRGYNPSLARITHATAALAALDRGARLVVVDPRRVGLAGRAHQWLRVRPGTDTALALSIAHVMIARGAFDRDFVRDWTNGPLLVREDDARLLRATDVDPSHGSGRYVAWDAARAVPVGYDPVRGAFDAPDELALDGRFDVETFAGPIACRPVFARLADLCRRYEPNVAERITGVAAAAIEAPAKR